MKTKNSSDAVPRALREVWEWKDAVNRELAGLTTGEALTRIHTEAGAICRKYSILRARPHGERLIVAEDPTDYGRKDNDETKA